ncbi:hypothetical protein [Mesorhizobium sp. ZC-5]|uniref:hypothetical protein n=1 Tax=Mesorhizobium sp. ZC-5 TaxID=2986066 RepID=UPI0021E7113A|nr:hypothetical protein [Mesorhizobium sp. ZC-5]MCV3240492.1 hypothetical protein [Mesorhizobium sp. ZC-5]
MSNKAKATLAIAWVLYLLICLVLFGFGVSIATPMMALGVIPPLLFFGLMAVTGR